MGTIGRRLTEASIWKLGPGRHLDGDGLHLCVSESGARSWTLIWKRDGKRREMGLGSLKRLKTVAKARKEAEKRLDQIHGGLDPIEERNREKRGNEGVPTFGKVAQDLVAAKTPSWRSAKHAAQWAATLETHAKALLDTPVDKIDTAAVLAVLTPLWGQAPETASRVRGRIEAVIDAARALGHIDQNVANPARWRGHLDKLLMARTKLSRGHHRAMDYGAVPGFMARLRATGSIQARALEFCVLTAARSGEVLGGCWSEIASDGALWVIPGSRMKVGAEHRVPLSARAREILREVGAFRSGPDGFLFPSNRGGRLGGNAMLKALKELGETEMTVHGFRSSFRDWAGDKTQTPREVAEQALAHTIPGVEGDYRRSDGLEKRKTLMEAWSSYCGGETGGKVIALKPARAS